MSPSGGWVPSDGGVRAPVGPSPTPGGAPVFLSAPQARASPPQPPSARVEGMMAEQYPRLTLTGAPPFAPNRPALPFGAGPAPRVQQIADPSRPRPAPAPPPACRVQATRQVTRASVEWYGPNRPTFLGPFSGDSTPSYLKGEPGLAGGLGLLAAAARTPRGGADPPRPYPAGGDSPAALLTAPPSPAPCPQASSPVTTAGTPPACPPTPRPLPATASWR